MALGCVVVSLSMSAVSALVDGTSSAASLSDSESESEGINIVSSLLPLAAPRAGPWCRHGDLGVEARGPSSWSAASEQIVGAMSH